MVTAVYIGKFNSQAFDYNKMGDWNGYFPEAISPWYYQSCLYWDIFKASNVKQTDWGCWVIKMSKDELVVFITDKYREYASKANDLKEMLLFVDTLNDTDEYLLTAIEVM